MRIADCLAEIRDTHKLEVVFKASFDKVVPCAVDRSPG